MPFLKSKRIKQFISIGLSAALIYNTNLPAFGQEFFSPDNPPHSRQRAANNSAFQQLYQLPPAVTDNTNYDHTRAEVDSIVYNYFSSQYNRKMASDAYARAEEIKKEILGDEQAEVQREHFGGDAGRAAQTPPDYKAEYFNFIRGKADEKKQENENGYRNFLQELNRQEQAFLSEGVPQTKIDEWKAGELAEKQGIYNENNAAIENFYQDEVNWVNNNYEEFLRGLKEGAEDAFYQHLKGLFNELMLLYGEDPERVKDQVLELTPVIISVTNRNKEHIYNFRQQRILLNLYYKVIEDETLKAKVDESPLTNPCGVRGYCPELINAINGISVLSMEGKELIDGQIIVDTIENFKDTPAGVSVLVNGISGLLVMKNYEMVREILKNASKEEYDIDYWDNINFMSLAGALVKVRGKYLGTVSSKAEYWNGAEYHNVYTDIAQILAEDGSREALSILHDFSVGQCIVQRVSNVQRSTLAKYKVSCGGIKPFLVGALLSGKSNANQYRLSRPIGASQYLGTDGRIHNTDIGNRIAAINETESAYYGLANEGFDGDASAMLALYIMNQGMGDLSAQAEYSLDSQLYNAFKNKIPERFLHSKVIIIDEDRFAKKESRMRGAGVLYGVGIGADIWMLITCVWDIVGLSGKALLFGKGLFNAIKVAKLALNFRSIPAIAKIAANYTKTVFMRQKIVVRATQFGRNLKKLPKEYTSVGRINLINASQYTNEVFRQSEISLGFARMGGDVTPNIRGIARQVVFNDEAGLFALRAGSGNLGYSKQALGALQELVDAANIEAKSKYRISKLFRKNINFSTIFLEELETNIAGSAFAIKDKEILSAFFRSSDFSKALAAADANVAKVATEGKSGFVPFILPLFSAAKEQRGQKMGVDFVINEKIPAFSKDIPKYATVTEKDGRFVINFFKNETDMIDMSTFKLSFETTEDFADFARASADLRKKGLLEGVEGLGNIEIKFIPQEANTFWTRNFRNVFARDKERLFSGRGTVSILGKDKTVTETGITLKTYKQYDGMRLVIDENIGGITTYKGMNPLYLTPTDGSFFLPKYQIGNFLEFAKLRGLETPWKIQLGGGLNKMKTLYTTALVSLGAALTGLHGSLSKNYEDINTKQLALITVVLPYLFSFGAPFVSPFVKRYGAVNILKASLYMSVASLALPMAMGFHGFGGIQADNPFPKPSPVLLYPSALMVGFSSLFMRGASGKLVQAVGGGSGALKVKALKSVSSFMMILPPVIGAGIDYISPKYFKNPDGTLYLDESGNPVQKHWFDFSFSYPVMLAIAGAALYKVKKTQFDVNIGRAAIGNNFGAYIKDGLSSYRTLLRREMVPLTAGSLLLTGVESAELYNYSNSLANEYVGNSIKTESLIPVFALLMINTPAFITRMKSKPILNAFGGDNMLGYRNMITASVAFTGAGTYLLAKQHDPYSFAAGLALTSIGFSQITAGVLRFGHHRLATELKVPKHIVTSWDVSYSVVYLGMSVVPYLYASASDKNTEGLEVPAEDRRSLKNSSMQEMINIPTAAYILGSALIYRGMRSPVTAKNFSAFKLLGPLGFAAETFNPAFEMFNTKPSLYQVPQRANTFTPHLEYNPKLPTPHLQITSDFSITPMR